MTAGPLSDRERVAWLRLSRTENVGPVTFDHLLSRYGSASAALAALPELAKRGGRIDPLTIPTADQTEDEIAAGQKIGARLLAACEPFFPRRLAALDPPPPLIWALGRVELLNRPSVAMVGARIASAAGQRFARALAVDLGKAGHVVVSGLARGIDGAAHEGALASGTVAVLGGGVDDVYPPEHADLHARIAAEGCIVSESRPGHRAQAKDFPRRNRIISGLSLGVVVVEAELKSGSLITARLAAEQGREVFAVPGSPLDPRARGTNDLIRQGAAVCEGVDDVLRTLEGIRSLGESDRAPYAAPPTNQRALDAAADRLRGKVEALLSPVGISRDDLIRAVGEPAPMVLAALVELVLAGRAEASTDGLFSRS